MRTFVWGSVLAIGVLGILWGLTDRGGNSETLQGPGQATPRNRVQADPGLEDRVVQADLSRQEAFDGASDPSEERKSPGASGARDVHSSESDSKQTRAGDSGGDDLSASPLAETGFSVERLEELGFGRHEASLIRDRWESARESALASLEIEDPTLGVPGNRVPPSRQRRSEAELNSRLREALGDEDYEASLYALQEPNWVEIRRVLPQSPAFQAGIQAGDRLLTLNGRDLFSVPELVGEIGYARESGEILTVVLLRGSQTVSVEIPAHGSLGMAYRGVSATPR